MHQIKSPEYFFVSESASSAYFEILGKNRISSHACLLTHFSLGSTNMVISGWCHDGFWTDSVGGYQNWEFGTNDYPMRCVWETFDNHERYPIRHDCHHSNNLGNYLLEQLESIFQNLIACLDSSDHTLILLIFLRHQFKTPNNMVQFQFLFIFLMPKLTENRWRDNESVRSQHPVHLFLKQSEHMV